MPTLKATIHWEIIDNDTSVIKSSVEQVTSIDDAQNWIFKMLEHILEIEVTEEDLDEL